MINPTTKINAVRALYGRDSYHKCSSNGEVIWKDDHETTAEETAAIDAKFKELQAEYDAQEYARKREAEYPSIADLVVALYDTDDKSAIETKRAAVKLKFPKP